MSEQVLALCTEPGYGEHGTNYQVDCAFCWDAMEVNSRKLAALASTGAARCDVAMECGDDYGPSGETSHCANHCRAAFYECSVNFKHVKFPPEASSR